MIMELQGDSVGKYSDPSVALPEPGRESVPLFGRRPEQMHSSALRGS